PGPLADLEGAQQARGEIGFGTARPAPLAFGPGDRIKLECKAASALAPGAAEPVGRAFGELPCRPGVAALRVLGPAAAIFLDKRERLEPRAIVIRTASGPVPAPGVEAGADRIAADAPIPDADPRGPVLRDGGRGQQDRGEKRGRGPHATSRSIAQAMLTSRRDRPPASWVVSVISTRL